MFFFTYICALLTSNWQKNYSYSLLIRRKICYRLLWMTRLVSMLDVELWNQPSKMHISRRFGVSRVWRQVVLVVPSLFYSIFRIQICLLCIHTLNCHQTQIFRSYNHFLGNIQLLQSRWCRWHGLTAAGEKLTFFLKLNYNLKHLPSIYPQESPDYCPVKLFFAKIDQRSLWFWFAAHETLQIAFLLIPPIVATLDLVWTFSIGVRSSHPQTRGYVFLCL